MRYAIALIAVLFGVGLATPAFAQITSTSWYGYAVTGSTYTSTTADWTMPSVSCTSRTSGSYVAIWTGLDGYASATTEQIGAVVACSGGEADYYGWYELYPSPVVEFTNPLKAGDELAASVSYDGSSKFTLSLDDVTQGWDQAVVKTLSGAARSSAETVVEVPSDFTCPPPRIFADFTGDTVDGKALGSLNPIELTGSNTHIIVSPVDGEAFSVTCG
jgi:hypothetical protein